MRIGILSNPFSSPNRLLFPALPRSSRSCSSNTHRSEAKKKVIPATKLVRGEDLTVFGEIESTRDGDVLVCTLHGWKFDCETGRCLTSADHPLDIRKR